jgi:hypothetical protein
MVDGTTKTAKDHKFILPSGLVVTYGQINGLAGDFYGTSQPISDGTTDENRQRRFMAAFNALARDSIMYPYYDTKAEAEAIINYLQREIKAVNEAIANGVDPSEAYATLPSSMRQTMELNSLTSTRTESESMIPSYIGLLHINFDHFGTDMHLAYEAGHAKAIEAAVCGNLEEAYTINAFADHFLQDMFSSGHLRVPRRYLHDRTMAWDYLSFVSRPVAEPRNCESPRKGSLTIPQKMHDEESAIGLTVQNGNGETWTAYGDARAFDAVAATNKAKCLAAVQASADEIYRAYSSYNTIPPSQYAYQNLVPLLDLNKLVRDESQTLVPLFRCKDANGDFTLNPPQNGKVYRRQNVENRTNWTSWMEEADLPNLLSTLYLSAWWDRPMTVDGPKCFLDKSGLTAASMLDGSYRVYIQERDGEIVEASCTDGTWANALAHVTYNAKKYTPLAAYVKSNGQEVCCLVRQSGVLN